MNINQHLNQHNQKGAPSGALRLSTYRGGAPDSENYRKLVDQPGWTMLKSASSTREMCLFLYLAMDQYLLIPFLVGWTSIYQLFWCSPGVQGFVTLPFNISRDWVHNGKTIPRDFHRGMSPSGFRPPKASRIPSRGRKSPELRGSPHVVGGLRGLWISSPMSPIHGIKQIDISWYIMIYPLWELGLTNQEQLDPFLFGWWLSPTPLKNHGVRQLGWWNSQLNMEKHNSCSKQPTSI